jgi:hypothetical protein
MFLGRRLHGIWVGEQFSSVSPMEILTWFVFVLVFFFVVRSAYFGWFFQATRLSTEVTGFFQSGSLQPWPCWFFMLDAWPRRSLPRSALVGHGLSSRTRLVVLRWFWGLSAVVARVLHAPSTATTLPDASPFFGFCFGLFFLFFHSLPL